MTEVDVLDDYKIWRNDKTEEEIVDDLWKNQKNAMMYGALDELEYAKKEDLSSKRVFELRPLSRDFVEKIIKNLDLRENVVLTSMILPFRGAINRVRISPHDQF